MRVAARIERFDFVKTLILDPARQDEMANQMRFAWGRAGESHPHLKDDARFLRNHMDRPTGAHLSGELKKNV